MLSNNNLYLSAFLTGSVLFFTMHVTVNAEEMYSPPKMFEQGPVVTERIDLKQQIVVEEQYLPQFSVIPQKKPKQILRKAVSVEKEPPVVMKDLGVSKVIAKARAVDAPEVEALSLTPNIPRTSVNNDDKQTVETTIAFLPAGVELTVTQKNVFEDIIQTYFIERDAKQIVIRIYASPEAGSLKQNSAKRKALSRGLNVRDWLLNLGIRSDQVILKAIGYSNDDSELPDRADIEIVF